MTPTDKRRQNTLSRPASHGRHLLTLITDDFLQPGVVVCLIFITTAQLIEHQPHMIVVIVFVITAVLALVTWIPRRNIPPAGMIGIAGVSAVAAGVLAPLAPTTAAAAFVFIASSAAGEKLLSRVSAYLVALAGAVSAIVATVLTRGAIATPTWPWWLNFAIVLPVFIGLTRRARRDALHSAQTAAALSDQAREANALAARYAERNRVSREIHDILGHSLSGITLQLELADVLHQRGDNTGANRAVTTAHTLALEGTEETRRAITALRAETRPLEEILRGLAHTDETAFNLVGIPDNWGAETEHAAFRIAQEALTNARRHAPGSTKTMTLTYEPCALTLKVENSPALPREVGTTSGSGSGLVGMNERAQSIGANLVAEPTPNGGWHVTLELQR